MGRITTHILDTAHGCPAQGVRLTLSRLDGETRLLVKEAVTNHDGRADAPLLEGAALTVGVYEIIFHIGAYFAQTASAGVGASAGPAFLDLIPLRFGVADAGAHYHVPLLVTPWSFSTYRGS